jgi:hypothetical protein
VPLTQHCLWPRVRSRRRRLQGSISSELCQPDKSGDEDQAALSAVASNRRGSATVGVGHCLNGH